MVKYSQQGISYKKERVVLCDILPYEVPPFFSNSSFYHFLIKYKIRLEEDPNGDCLYLYFSTKDQITIAKLIKLTFGLKFNEEYTKEDNEFRFKFKSTLTIPFQFKVLHNKGFRDLTIIHPLNQLAVVNFYDKYKYNLIYYTNISRFSLRRPYKVASMKYFKDSTNEKLKSSNSEVEIIETSNNEYTSLKSYFNYKKYNNINQFYESYEFHRAEKNFDKLLKFDISKCFDSIYTHTLPWAIMNKRIVKDNVTKPVFRNSFGNSFDVLMQKMNYNETNGIIIGSEFSRIFAEIILQKVDKNVEKQLKDKNLSYKKDYDIFRYVDDFFVFYTKDSIKEIILDCYKVELQRYNLFLNDAKTNLIEKPIITNITIAKENIRELVEKIMFFRFYDSSVKNQLGIKYFTAKDVITNYKKILSLTGSSYKDLQNYFLAIIFNKVITLIKKFDKEQKKLLEGFISKDALMHSIKNTNTNYTRQDLIDIEEVLNEEIKVLKSYYKQIYRAFVEIIELTFFIYSVLPKVTYSIKVSHILFRIIDFVKNQEVTKQKYKSKKSKFYEDDYNLDFEEEVGLIAFDFDKKHIIFKSIFDNIARIFKNDVASMNAEVETLYLLQITEELGQEYKLNEKVIIKHFNIRDEISDTINFQLNYFTIISVLNYIKNDHSYNNIRNDLKRIISNFFENYDSKDAESTMLLIDVLNCPYFGNRESDIEKFRLKILNLIKFFKSDTPVTDKKDFLEKVSELKSLSFFRWKDRDLGIELNTKRGHSVY